MLALSPSLFSSATGWPLMEDPITNNNEDDGNYIYKEKEVSSLVHHEHEPFLHFSTSQPEMEVDRSTPLDPTGSDQMMVKKLNHNASERDRRKKINCLYSSLRCLLPAADKMKKLSNPATVSRSLKYIPELQQQVEDMLAKKEELLQRLSRHEDSNFSGKQRKSIALSPSAAISAIRLNDKEIAVQISTSKAQQNSSLSDLLACVEEDGLHLLDVSSSESFGGRVLFNLHLQVENSSKLECERLSEKLLSCMRRGKSAS